MSKHIGLLPMVVGCHQLYQKSILDKINQKSIVPVSEWHIVSDIYHTSPMDLAEKLQKLHLVCHTKKRLKQEAHPLTLDLGLDKATAEYGYRSFALILVTRSFLYSMQWRAQHLQLISFSILKAVFCRCWDFLDWRRGTVAMPQPGPYPNWVFSLFSGIGFVLCCIPFPWHVKGK